MAVLYAETAEEVRIMITEPIARVGVDLLRRELPQARIDERFGLEPTQLRALIADYTALIVRGETKVTDEVLSAALHLKVIGRAGSGVENIDLDAAFRRRVLVGVELANKTLGILGLGRIGREVARLAQAFAMQVLAYDPVVSAEQARRVGVTLLGKEEVLRQADIMTLHAAPAGGRQAMRPIMGAWELALLRPGAYLVNCSRGACSMRLPCWTRSREAEWPEWRSMSSVRNPLEMIPSYGVCSRMSACWRHHTWEPQLGRRRREWRSKWLGMSSRRCAAIPWWTTLVFRVRLPADAALQRP